jgi:hypothetical protein
MSLQVTIDLDSPQHEALRQHAQARNMSVENYLKQIALLLAGPIDPRILRKLPAEERDRLLALQAEEAASFYETDLARPVAERELTAFASIAGESTP